VQKNNQLILLAVLLFFFIIFVTRCTVVIKQPRSMYAPLRASCLVKTAVGSGSGVFLDTGYVITCAHVVDSDMDGYVRANEREVVCEFLGGPYPHGQKFEVVYASRDVDVAILQPIIKFNYEKRILDRLPKISPSLEDGFPGDKVFAVGAPHTQPLLISEGFIGFSRDKYRRASCFISTGNSGGGIFNTTNDLLGLVTAVFMVRSFTDAEILIPMPKEDGDIQLLIGKMSMPLEVVVNNICAYTSIVDIRNNLNDKFLGSLLDKQPEESLFNRLQEPWINGLIRVGFNLTLFFGFFFFFSKDLLD